MLQVTSWQMQTLNLFLGFIFYLRHYLCHYYARRQAIRALGCRAPASLPSSDPFWNISLVRENIRLLKERRYCDGVSQRFLDYGNTHAYHTGKHFIATCEPQNVKTVLATKFEHFSLGARRDMAFKPIIGHGIFTSNGDEWEQSRKLLRPTFASMQMPDLDTLEIHVRNLIKVLPRDGSQIDLQQYFIHLMTDVSTDLILGSSTFCLTTEVPAGKKSALTTALDDCNERIQNFMQLGAIAKLIQSRKYHKSKSLLHGVVDEHIRRIVTNASNDSTKNDRHSSLIDDLASRTTELECLRAEALSLLFAGRDTTASLLSHLFFHLSRSALIWEKLKQEVDTLQGQTPTHEQLKSLKYLRSCLDEALRLHPVVPLNTRTAVQDTFLPVGGGADGKSPVFVMKGAVVLYSSYAMHRREDLWGDDAQQYRPERWVGFKKGWHYIPFHGGPRTCLGQHLALTIASYISVRVVQEFQKVQPKDLGPWVEGFSVTLWSGNGVQVALTPSEA